jgi:hypothetical protein
MKFQPSSRDEKHLPPIDAERGFVHLLHSFLLTHLFIWRTTISMENERVIVTLPDYDGMRRQLSNSLRQLVVDRARIDKQIIALQEILKGFDVLCRPVEDAFLADTPLPSDPQSRCPSENELAGKGLTDAIRIVFQRTFEPLSPIEVRDRLKLANYDVPGENPSAAVHGVVRRLFENGEIKQQMRNDGKVSYRWISAFETALKVLDEAGTLNIENWNVPNINLVPVPSETIKQEMKPRIHVQRRRRTPKALDDPDNDLYTSGIRPFPKGKK